MARRRFSHVVDLRSLYLFRPSLVFNSGGRSLLRILTAPLNGEMFTDDWLDGIIMTLILTHNWDKFGDEDIPPIVELASFLYSEDDVGMENFLSNVTEEETEFIHKYIDILINLKERIPNPHFPFNIISKDIRIKFDGEFANMSEVVTYESA